MQRDDSNHFFGIKSKSLYVWEIYAIVLIVLIEWHVIVVYDAMASVY